MIEILREVLIVCVELVSTLLEFCATGVMAFTAAKAIGFFFLKNENLSVDLGEGIALTLEFLLAAEVLHTVVADEISDLILLGALVVFRAIMTVEIHWELSHEKKHHEPAI